MPVLSKAVRVLRSSLAPAGKARYFLDAILGDSASPTYRLTGGGSLHLRPRTTDRKVFDEIFIDQVYAEPLAAIPAPVRTIVDLGANIGLTTIALLRQFPESRAVAVEPDPDNFRLLEENLRTAGLQHRAHPVRAFAGAESGYAELVDSGNGAWGMRMGARSSSGVRVVTLSELANRFKLDEISLLKCDIEGAERELFATLPAWDALVRYIALELHADLYPVQDFLAHLKTSPFAWTIHGALPDRSPLAVLGLERAQAPHRARPAAASTVSAASAAFSPARHQTL